MRVPWVLEKCILIASIINFSFEKKQKQRRIIGGNAAKPGEYPALISLRLIAETTKHICGGTLIRDNFILTAAHCFEGESVIGLENLVLYEMMGGDINREAVSTSPNSRQIMTPNKIFIHEKYDHEQTLNDVALIMLIKPVEISENLSIIEMAETVPAWNTSCTVIGWGVETNDPYDFEPSETLMKVDIKLLAPKFCQNEEYASFTPGMELCAGDLHDAKDSCLGDSGGPLICENELVGAVSYGAGCGSHDNPAVYSSVVYFKSWIENIIENSKIKSNNQTNATGKKTKHRTVKRILNSNSKPEKIHGDLSMVLISSSVRFIFSWLEKIMVTV